MKKSRSILESFNFAISGVLYAIKTQRNIRIHFFAAIIALLAAFFFEISSAEFLLLFFAISMVIISEMFNTAIEAAVDLATDKYHPLARIAKNVAAGAVLISTINAVVVGYFIFITKIIQNRF